MATDLKFDVSALDRASATFAKLGKVVERFEKRLEELDGKRVSADVEVRTEKAEREIGRFATDARRRITAALANLPDVELNGDSTDLDRDLAKARADLAALDGKTVGVDIDAATFDAEARRIRDELARIGRESPDIQVQTDTATAIASLKLVDAEADRLDGRTVKVKVDVDKSLSDSLIKVAQLGRALGALALPAAAIAAAPQLASLGAAAATATGALWLIPAAGAAAGLAVGALALGFSNLGDALGDGKKAAEAFEKLSKNGKELVTTLRGLSPAWTTLRQSVQDAFLRDAGRHVEALATQYLPTLRSALTFVADGFNQAGREVSGFLQDRGSFNDLRITLGNVGAAISAAAQAAAPLTAAFVDIAAVGSPILVELGEGFARASERAAAFVDRARQTGELERWMRDGIRALGQLGSITKNVATTLGGLFRAATASGADFLGTLDDITARISAFVNSAQGQSSITALFRDIRDGVQAAAPGIEAFATAVATVVQKLADAGVLRAAGAALSAIASAAAPLVELFGGLGPALAGFFGVVEALAPVLVPLAAGLAALKLASSGWQKAREFPNWLMSVKAGSDEAIRSNERLSRAVGSVQAPFVRAADGVRAFRDEMALQRGLAAAQGQDIGRLGAAMAAFETSQLGAVTALRNTRDQMRDTYSSTSQAVQGFADNAARAANQASVALGDKLAGAASKGVEGIIRIPGAVAAASRSLNTGLQQAVIRAGLELEALPGRVRDVGNTLRTSIGVAALEAGDRLRDFGAAARDAGNTVRTAIGVAALDAADRIRQLPAAARDAATTLRTAVGVAAIDAGQKLQQLGTNAATAGRNLATGLRDGVTNAATALRNLPTAAADAGRALATNLQNGMTTAATAVRNGVTTATDAVRQLPARLGEAARSAGQSVATGLRTIPDGIRNAFSTVGSAVDSGLGHLGRFASSAAGAAAAAGQAITTGLSRGMSGLLGALGGPWGLLITAATVAMGIVAGEQAKAAQAAQEHKAAVDELAGSFDKVSGAATNMSREIQAANLANVKLKDGTTSLAGALGQLGISTQDWVDATTGNIPKQQMIAEKLNATTKAAIEQSPVWRNNATEVQRWGVSLDDVVAAANGNVQAQERLTAAAKLNAGGVLENEAANRMLVDSLMGLGGTAGEVSSQFGAALGKFNEAKTQFDLVKDATASFEDGLKSLGLEGGRVFAALATGAPVTAEMGAALTAVGQGAQTMALEVGKSVTGMSNAEQGAIAARDKMAGLRQQFIDTAVASGMGVEQANALATSYGLIPAAVETIIRSNATGVQAEMITLAAQINSVPAGKDVIVNAMTDEARQKLTDMGFQVTQLPDGTFQVTANTDAARANLDGLIAFGNGQVITMTGDMNVNPATGKITQTVDLGNGQTAIMTYDARPDPATGKIMATVDLGNGQTAIMALDANPAQATGQINGTVTYGNGQTSTIKVAANAGAANSAIDNAARPRTAVITVVYNGLQRNIDPSIGGGRITGSGGAIVGYSGGGINGYAGGGLHRPSRRRGLVIPGYAPGRDDQNAVLAKGEAVLVPELVRTLGARRILSANAEASGGRKPTIVGQVARMMDGSIGKTSGAAQISVAMSTASRGGSSAAVVAAVHQLNSAFGAGIQRLSQRIAALESRNVNINNVFPVQAQQGMAEAVARVQRTQAALGLFGGG